jgi:hypothetical protein
MKWFLGFNIAVTVLPDQVAVSKANAAFQPDGSLTGPKQQASISARQQESHKEAQAAPRAQTASLLGFRHDPGAIRPG